MWRGINKAVLITALIVAYLLTVAVFAARLVAQHSAHIAWTLPLPGAADLVPDLLSDGTLCCGTRGTLYWVSPGGQTTATYHIPPDCYTGAWMGGGGDLWFISLVNTAPASGTPPALLRALNRAGQVLWDTALENVQDISWICFDDRQVYLTLDNSELCAVDFAGEIAWRAAVGQGQVLASAGKPTGGLYYLNLQGELVALDRQGVEQWRTALGVVTAGYLVVAPDGRVLVQKGYGGDELYAVSAEGKLLWTVMANNAGSNNPPAVYPFFSPNYQMRMSGNYYPAAAGDGTVYACAYGSVLIALSTSGRELWRYELRGDCIAPAVGRDGTVYAAVAGKGILAFTPQGRIKWRCTGLKEISSAPVVGPDGKVYVEVTDKLVALEP